MVLGYVLAVAGAIWLTELFFLAIDALEEAGAGAVHDGDDGDWLLG